MSVEITSDEIMLKLTILTINSTNMMQIERNSDLEAVALFRFELQELIKIINRSEKHLVNKYKSRIARIAHLLRINDGTCFLFDDEITQIYEQLSANEDKK